MRDVSGGYTMCCCLIAQLFDDEEESEGTGPGQQTQHISVPFQNEYLTASLVSVHGNSVTEETVCIVLDPMSILSQDDEALGSTELRYSLKL